MLFRIVVVLFIINSVILSWSCQEKVSKQEGACSPVRTHGNYIYSDSGGLRMTGYYVFLTPTYP
jgi:hypothetical protein